MAARSKVRPDRWNKSCRLRITGSGRQRKGTSNKIRAQSSAGRIKRRRKDETEELRSTRALTMLACCGGARGDAAHKQARRRNTTSRLQRSAARGSYAPEAPAKRAAPYIHGNTRCLPAKGSPGASARLGFQLITTPNNRQARHKMFAFSGLSSLRLGGLSITADRTFGFFLQ